MWEAKLHCKSNLILTYASLKPGIGLALYRRLGRQPSFVRLTTRNPMHNGW